VFEQRCARFHHAEKSKIARMGAQDREQVSEYTTVQISHLSERKKGGEMKKRLVLIVVLLFALACTCGSTATTAGGITPAAEQTEAVAPVEGDQAPADTQEPSNTPEPPPAESASIGKVGDTIVNGDYIVTLVNVERGEVYSEWSQPDEGNILVAVEIVIESGADEGVSVNPLYCSLKDSDGYEYSMYLFGKDPSLGAENDLPKGDKMRGWVTFEVPESAAGFIFSYEPISFTETIRIRFELGF
jgi:hypothetical protein